MEAKSNWMIVFSVLTSVGVLVGLLVHQKTMAELRGIDQINLIERISSHEAKMIEGKNGHAKEMTERQHGHMLELTDRQTAHTKEIIYRHAAHTKDILAGLADLEAKMSDRHAAIMEMHWVEFAETMSHLNYCIVQFL